MIYNILTVFLSISFAETSDNFKKAYEQGCLASYRPVLALADSVFGKEPFGEKPSCKSAQAGKKAATENEKCAHDICDCHFLAVNKFQDKRKVPMVGASEYSSSADNAYMRLPKATKDQFNQFFDQVRINCRTNQEFRVEGSSIESLFNNLDGLSLTQQSVNPAGVPLPPARPAAKVPNPQQRPSAAPAAAPAPGGLPPVRPDTTAPPAAAQQ